MNALLFTAGLALAYGLARVLAEPKRRGKRRPGTRIEDLARRRGAAVYVVLPASVGSVSGRTH